MFQTTPDSQQMNEAAYKPENPRRVLTPTIKNVLIGGAIIAVVGIAQNTIQTSDDISQPYTASQTEVSETPTSSEEYAERLMYGLGSTGVIGVCSLFGLRRPKNSKTD